MAGSGEMKKLKRFFHGACYRPYRRPGSFRTLLAILSFVLLAAYSASFWPAKQVGLERLLGENPLPMVNLPEKLGAFMVSAKADGKPLGLRMTDCWGSSGFPLADRIPGGTIVSGGQDWEGLQRAIAHISRKNFRAALDILSVMLPVPASINDEAIRRTSDPSPTGNRAVIFNGLVRYTQGIAFLRLSEANTHNSQNLGDILQKAVFSLRLSLKHFERLNNPAYPGSRFSFWQKEDRAWDNVSLSSEYGAFPLRFVYGALGVAYLRARNLEGYPRADSDYAAAQKKKYGQDADPLAAAARGFLDAADEAVKNSGTNGPDSETVALWRLAMGFSNVGLCARNLSGEDPLYHYTAGILLSALAGMPGNERLKGRARELAVYELAVADGEKPAPSAAYVDGSHSSGGMEDGKGENQVVSGPSGRPLGNSGPNPVDVYEESFGEAGPVAGVLPGWRKKERMAAALLAKNFPEAMAVVDDVPDPSSITSGGPDMDYGKLAGDLAVARYIFSGDFKKADQHVKMRRQDVGSLPGVKDAFENMLALFVRDFLGGLSTSLSPKNAEAWRNLLSAFSAYEWLGAQKAYLRRPSPVFSLFAGARFGLFPGLALIFLVVFFWKAKKSDEFWGDRMLGNAFAEDVSAGLYRMYRGKSGARAGQGQARRAGYSEDGYVAADENSGDAPDMRGFS